MPHAQVTRCALAAAAVCAMIGSASVHAGALPIDPFTEEALSRGLIYLMQEIPLGQGCGFADLDNDADPDIIIIGAEDGHVGIFENDGSGFFTDRSEGSGIPVLEFGAALTAGDYDGDGDIDIYLTNTFFPNVLVRNEGDFHFTDVSASAGVDDLGEGKGSCFGDFDGDDWLDLYVPNYAESVTNKLFRNLGDGTFQDVSVEQTVDDGGFGYQSVWSDYDRDGDLDLYLSNDKGHAEPLFQPNQLWRNDGGQLVNVSESSGANAALFSMGLACGDFDNNGWPDFYLTNIPGGGDMNNPLLLNQGDGSFTESAIQAGVDNPWFSWSSIFFDFDNNGFMDLYVNNLWDPNTLYANGGVFPVEEIGAEAGVIASPGASFGSAVGDVDLDGDLDLLVNNHSFNVQLFINQEGDNRRWMRYHMVAPPPNHFAVGGNVDTRLGENWKYREILAGGNGFLGQNELVLHVGAGDALQADEIVATWPGGTPVRVLTGTPTNRTWTLYPPEMLGDGNGDGLINLADFWILLECYGAAIQPGCEIMDFDGNSFIGEDDYTAFAAQYDDPLFDCDGNGQDDLLDILMNPDMDENGTGIPDACESAGDLNGDGSIGILDLLLVLGAWGPCQNPDACPADLDGDGAVGITDLLMLVSAWD